MGDLSWSALLEEQCPYLKKLITNEDGQIDGALLQQIMEKLNLDPCTTDKREECLERNCSLLWRYYVQRKHHKNKHWKKCANSVTNRISSDCAEADTIAQHLFQDGRSYKPNDLLFLYDLVKLEQPSSEEQQQGTLQKVSKKRGDAVLKTNYAVNPASIHGNNSIRFLSIQNPELTDYFVRIYDLEIGTNQFQPTRKKSDTTNMYILHESMDGSILTFQQHFQPQENVQPRDPDFWNRMTRMCIHAFTGLYELHHLGFAHNRVSGANLCFKMDLQHTLVAVKWTNFDHVAENSKNDDAFQFGLLIYQILFGPMDKHWKETYAQPQAKVHDNILKLFADERMKPISMVAYHFLVNQDLFPSEKRWSFLQAHQYLEKIQVPRDVLKPLPDW